MGLGRVREKDGCGVNDKREITPADIRAAWLHMRAGRILQFKWLMDALIRELWPKVD